MPDRGKGKNTGPKLLLLAIVLFIVALIVPAPFWAGLFVIGFICLVAGIISLIASRKKSRKVETMENIPPFKPEPSDKASAPIVSDELTRKSADKPPEVKTRETRELEIRQWRETIASDKIEAIPEYEIVPAATPCNRQTGYEGIDFSNITPKGKYGDVVVFDTETTGLSPSRDRILEIAAIRFRHGSPVSRFHTYINPEREIPQEASRVNHITSAMVADAPKIGSIMPAFDEFVGDSILVAHNLDFDLRFIYYSGSRVFDKKRKYIDTLEQAQRKLKKPGDVANYKLKHYAIILELQMQGRTALWVTLTRPVNCSLNWLI